MVTSAPSPGTTDARRRRRRRAGVALALLALGLPLVLLARPSLHLARVALADRHDAPFPDGLAAPGFADDVSRQERCRVAEVWTAPRDPDAAVESLRDALARASARGLPVSIGGARHSMGGHTIAPDGVALDMRGFDRVEVDAERRVVRAGSGARWSRVLRALRPHGLSVAVMQSNDTFTVGGSISVNCHGWQHGRAPIGSTVRSMRVMLASGEVVTCSRTENADLFRHVIGGYGLFGVILDVELDVVPDEVYRHELEVVDAAALGPAFLARAAEPGTGLAVGRISIAEGTFLREALLKTLCRVDGAVPAEGSSGPPSRGLHRVIFRGSVGSEYGKSLRWRLERDLSGWLLGGETTRTAELAEPVDWYENRARDGTDVLFEAFVPHAALADYVEAIRAPLLRSPVDLLNVTVRDVRADRDSALPYAREGVFAVVLFMHQRMGPEGDAHASALTRELIDLSLALGGTYYLPYRRHATREQFERAYPMAAEFFAARERWDPGGRFQNRWALTYAPRD